MEEGVIHQSLASHSMDKNHQQSLARPPNQIGDLLAESVENLKLSILLIIATCLLFVRLSLFKRALKQLKSTQKRAHTWKNSLY